MCIITSQYIRTERLFVCFRVSSVVKALLAILGCEQGAVEHRHHGSNQSTMHTIVIVHCIILYNRTNCANT